MSYEAFPGGDIIEQGLCDLAEGRETAEALLVSIGAWRLRRAGVPVPERVFPDPERRLYDRLAQDEEDSAQPTPATMRSSVGS